MTMEKPADFGPGPSAEVRRWLKELDLAEKTEKDWRQQGERIWRRYRGKGRKKNSFNILWSNTEVLAPALFNAPPSPDVRRRYRDDDPVGKVAAQVLERCLEFQTDTEEFMFCIKADVLDAILPGRGVSRVKYVPSLAPIGPSQEAESDADDEIVAWEQAEIDHIQWDDFRHGPGKTWAEVQWVAFRHRMTREELEELVADSSDTAKERARSIALDNCDDDQIDKDDELKTVFGTVEVWEMWCKEYRKVKYISKACLECVLKEIDDPLGLNGFFPCARPLYAIQDSSTLIPTPLFEQYAEQADELDRLSGRINRIVEAIKMRGVYDSTMFEIAQLVSADDNKLIPTQNAALWAERGGLEKAIYWMPIEQAAAVLMQLYEAREQCKRTIYELSGIADIRRGNSDARETLGAQELKADFGNQRISGLRLEIERYVRDLMRIMAELVAEKFSPETLLRMSQLKIPKKAEIDQKVAQTQAQAAAQGQDPMQAVQALGPRPPSLEDVIGVLHDDATRMFRIDVETDSMVAATIDRDMAGLREVLGGVNEIMQAFGPAVERGAVPPDAVKELIMVICRRAKLGSAVEDEFDKIKAPNPQQNGEAAKAQAQAQAAQIKAASDAQVAQLRVQSEAQVAQIKAASEARIAQVEAAAQQQTDIVRQRAEEQQHAMKLENEARLQIMQQKLDERAQAMELEFRRWEAELKAAKDIEVANIGAEAKVDNAATKASEREIASEVRQ